MRVIAFIGLGTMGAPMAANLVKAGFDVVGYNRSRPAVENLVAAGGRAASSVAEAVASAEVAVTMLPDSPDVEAVALGPDGLLAHLPAGALYVDMSSINPAVAVALAAAGAQRDVEVLDAPVSGGEPGARSASLSIMVGGTAEAFARAEPLFAALGTTIVHVGPAGAGQTVKAANQLLVGGHLALLAEAILLLEAAGVAPEGALRVLAGGLAGSTVLDRKSGAMLARSFAPSFRADLHAKDLRIVADLARRSSLVLPTVSTAAQLMNAVVARGNGDLDHAAVLTVVELLSGREPTP
ncbi:NAD(P)-dependent oxidoreductase [Asanoa iriomotensis]|uniref:2-hydroxy-3-oxopropionate reductase n=1 Tax=Asanoa iriomotensis TaxID=234613 RepID=A0ABQ4BYB9_9ACTN|nr:NAD(P)-binding domain-containing protein [Asanoa iriomotensis]GIF55521.1 2-hydroxy-3-oxopropionate reductase [Asanoa iriomotensis]